MSNEQVIKLFLEGKEGKTPLRNITNGIYSYKGRTLTSTGLKLINYSTPIAWWTNEGVTININKYSVTTSKIQNTIKRLCKEQGIEVKGVNL